MDTYLVIISGAVVSMLLYFSYKGITGTIDRVFLAWYNKRADAIVKTNVEKLVDKAVNGRNIYNVGEKFDKYLTCSSLGEVFYCQVVQGCLQEGIILDFSEVERIQPSFANAAFTPALGKISYSEFKQKFTFINISHVKSAIIDIELKQKDADR